MSFNIGFRYNQQNMKKGEKTYQYISATELTETIRSLLFGRLSAVQLLSNSSAWKPVSEELSAPANNAWNAYPDVRAKLPGISVCPRKEILNNGTGARDHVFYRYDATGLEAFHPLCEFYQEFVHRECRLIVVQAEHWRKDERLSTRKLQYEVISLNELIRGFVRLCEERKTTYVSIEPEPEERLRKYLAKLLKYELSALLLELSDRFHQLLPGKRLNTTSFYIHVLKQSVPDPVPLYRTRHSLVPELQGIHGNKKVVQQCMELKKMMGTAPPSSENEPWKEEYRRCIHLIENTCVAYYILNVNQTSEDQISALKNKPFEAETMIRQWRREVLKGKQPEWADRFGRHIDTIEPLLSMGAPLDIPSEANLLMNDIKTLRRECVSPLPLEISELNHQSLQPVHPALQDLVSIDELREKLQISLVTLNKYLEDSKVPVIRFSAKSRWLRSEDCRRFLDFYTTNGK